ncbi:rhamnosyltransferase [Pseudarthrobacter siccitolerans]|uniref:Rhamnosyltransferase n=1 Tax=Pseudarthrobacter siccitolerans TaxID=861266 RepID=A0ABU0PHL7_9MICC|nr:glycosyltransferase [Pseudarthrobacter siccitolerans]MDQ0673456.1 rhamnosyltransferase [Pseudarthrobacter siccitolerans]
MTANEVSARLQQNSEVCAVVSAFNPGPENVENVKWLLRYVSKVVIVDDGSPGDVTDMMSAFEELGAVVIRLDTNSGIAKALNTGIKAARERWNPEWVVTMDQDSRFSGNYIRAALATACSSSRPETVGMVCAESHNGTPLPTLGGTGEPEVFDPMTSGSLVRSHVFDSVGYFDDDFFIDCVDTEFNARLRDHGFRSLAGRGCDLKHSLGNARPMKIFGWRVRVGQKKLNVYYHPPFRVYYITRNSLVMARRFGRRQPAWVLRRLYMEVQSHIVRFVYGPNRRKHLIAAIAGAKDALRGRMGKIDDALAARLR